MLTVAIFLAMAIGLMATPASGQECTLKPGATCTTTGQITIPPGTPPGAYQVCFKVVDPVAHVGKDATACMTVNVVEPPPPGNDRTMTFVWMDRNTVEVFPIDLLSGFQCQRQTGGSSVLRVVAGGKTLKQIGVPNPTVGTQFAMRCEYTGLAVNVYLAGVVKLTVPVTSPPPPPPDTVADKTESFVFAKTDGARPFTVDLAPVVPYACERLVGGTALLRIRTGDQILKSISQANPQREVPFTLRCQATTASVILYLNDVQKLSVPR